MMLLTFEIYQINLSSFCVHFFVVVEHKKVMIFTQKSSSWIKIFYALIIILHINLNFWELNKKILLLYFIATGICIPIIF